MVYLTNTLTKQKEEFKPIKPGTVRMYNCGPTVYSYAHIGNLRSYVFADILRRVLEMNDLEVMQVVNITDIGHLASDADDGEDKMTKALKREGKPLTLEAMRELAEFYTEKFTDDLKALNIKMPQVMPRASRHIKEDIALIERLDEKGFVYKTSDGLYFDTSQDSDYGKLGGLSDDSAKARIETNSEKKNSRDFAVWKFNDTLGFESPWGKGFPGWHIECSAMSMCYLGETFDIHTGGVDHIPIHHNNEIAQSESATGKPYARYWLHNAFVNIGGPKGEGEKMAKSGENFITLSTIREKGLDPLSYRYWLLTAHYSTPITFSWEALQATEQSYKRLKHYLADIQDESGSVHDGYFEQFTDYLNDDLDTPKAIALMWEIISDSSVNAADKKATILKFDSVLGLGLDSFTTATIPEAVQKLVTEREEARQNKDWKRADKLRDEINKNGFTVKDTDRGPRLIPVSTSSTGNPLS